MNSKMLLAFSYDYVAFLVQSLDDLVDVKNIILFGSVARGQATSQSDIDIFIETTNPRMKNKIQKITEKFYSSDLYRRYWKLLGISNTIKPIVGTLDDWPDLKKSIIADGIYLYGKFVSATKGASYVILSWSKISSQTKRTHLNKKLYGWRYKQKRYLGLIQKINGKRLGANVIYVPLESSKVVLDLFKKMDIPVRVRYVSEIK
jgi:predicted nucleotidyltransferase